MLIAPAKARSSPPGPLIAVVLPPGEGFGPGRAGAVGLVVRCLGRVLPVLVLGGPQTGPVFDDVPFQRADPPFWLPGPVNFRFAAGLVRALRRLRPALVEVHNRTEVALALARRFPDTPVSLVLHNDPQWMRKARTGRERTDLLQRLARVITVSDFLRARLMEGVDPASVPAPVVLANPIDLAALPGPAAEREPVVLFAGRAVAEKGADVFVSACAEALPRLPGWRAVLIGADRFRANSPATAYVRSLNAACAKAGVRALGYMDHALVMRAMARAAIVVVPSRWQEPFGLAALEAMACGAALICSPRGALPEVAGDAAIYADPDQPGAVAAAIEALARDPARRHALVEAGRQRARRFGLVPAAARLAAIRREILEPSTADARH